MKPEAILSLDAGSSKVCGILFYIGSGSVPRILAAMHRKINTTTSGENDEYIPFSHIATLIQAMSRTFNITPRKAIISINASRVRLISSSGIFERKKAAKPLTRWEINEYFSELKSMVNEPGYELVHILPQKFLLDGKQFFHIPAGMSGSRIECGVTFVAVKKNFIERYREMLQELGIMMCGCYVDAINNIEICLSPEDKETGTMIIDFGANTTKFTIVKDGVIRSCGGINMGGNIITKDIKEISGVPWTYAEKIKKTAGSAYSASIPDNEVISVVTPSSIPREFSRKKLAEIIEARVREIIDILICSIETKIQWHQFVRNIILTGGGALLGHLPCLIEEITGKETYFSPHINNLIPVDDDELIKELSSPIYVSALGQIHLFTNGNYDPNPVASNFIEKMLSILGSVILEN